MKELTPDLYYLFRPGMELRTKDAEEIFGADDLHFKYSGLIYKTSKYKYKGSPYLYDLLPKPIKYNIKRFVEKAPDIYNNGYKANEKLYARLLEYLPSVDGKSQIYHGLMSGILKYKQGGFYFDKEGMRQLKLYELQEGTE